MLNSEFFAYLAEKFNLPTDEHGFTRIFFYQHDFKREFKLFSYIAITRMCLRYANTRQSRRKIRASERVQACLRTCSERSRNSTIRLLRAQPLAKTCLNSVQSVDKKRSAREKSVIISDHPWAKKTQCMQQIINHKSKIFTHVTN